MFHMVLNSISLFFQGKLFKSRTKALTQMFFGVVIGLIVFVLSLLISQNIFISSGLAALISGFIQPFLMKNIKFR